MKKIFDPRTFRHLLGIAGMINIMAGIFFAFFPHMFLLLFYKKESFPEGTVSSPVIMSIITLMFIFILIIGFGYVWSMKDPVRNKLYVLIGGLGKLAAVMLWAVSFFQGFANPIILLACINDVFLGFLFVLFYISNRKV